MVWGGRFCDLGRALLCIKVENLKASTHSLRVCVSIVSETALAYPSA